MGRFLPALAASVLAICSAHAQASESMRIAMKTTGTSDTPTSGRWYAPGDVEHGAAVFARNCAGCHGDAAQGAAGGSAAPALDGSGHSAHHDLDWLLDRVATGTTRMPAFADMLSLEDRRAAIAWMQSRWPEAVYLAWHRRHGLSSH